MAISLAFWQIRYCTRGKVANDKGPSLTLAQVSLARLTLSWLGLENRIR